MLKLEKNSRRGINILMRHRDPFLSKVLVQALCIALFWHLGAFLIFHVGGFKLFEETSSLPPVTVNADLHLHSQEDDALVHTTIDEEQRHRAFALIPPAAEPLIPEIYPSIPSLSFLPEYTNDNIGNPFEVIEKDIQDFYLTVLEKPDATPPISVHASGALSQRLISKDPSDFNIHSPDPLHWTFQVKVHDPDGKIFWYQPTEQLNLQNASLAKQIMDSLQFAPIRNGFVTSGAVEITLKERMND